MSKTQRSQQQSQTQQHELKRTQPRPSRRQRMREALAQQTDKAPLLPMPDEPPPSLKPLG